MAPLSYIYKPRFWSKLPFESSQAIGFSSNSSIHSIKLLFLSQCVSYDSLKTSALTFHSPLSIYFILFVLVFPLALSIHLKFPLWSSFYGYLNTFFFVLQYISFNLLRNIIVFSISNLSPQFISFFFAVLVCLYETKPKITSVLFVQPHGKWSITRVDPLIHVYSLSAYMWIQILWAAYHQQPWNQLH